VDQSGVPVGLDFSVDPVNPVADTYVDALGNTQPGLHLADLNLGTPLGVNRPDAIFEYGFETMRTAKQYRRAIDREMLLTQGYSLPTDFSATSTDVRESHNDAAIAARGLYEDVVQSNVVNGDLRKALLDEHVAVRKQARQMVTAEPSAAAPVLGVDYDVGDYCTGRAVMNGKTRLNGQVRVYGYEQTYDENDKETVVPTLTVS
jgi:hypothetical protein